MRDFNIFGVLLFVAGMAIVVWVSLFAYQVAMEAVRLMVIPF